VSFRSDLLTEPGVVARETVEAAAGDDPARLALAVLTGLLRLRATMDVVVVGVENIYGDAEFAEQLALLVAGAEVVRVTADDMTVLDEVVAGCDVVVGSRYHALVLALRRGRSIVAVETSARPGPSKLRDLVGSVGLETAYWTAGTGSPPLADAVTAALRRSADDAVGDRYADVHARSLTALDALTERLREHAGATAHRRSS
jgi:hypothetical protein